jgi:hypothetical protein
MMTIYHFQLLSFHLHSLIIIIVTMEKTSPEVDVVDSEPVVLEGGSLSAVVAFARVVRGQQPQVVADDVTVEQLTILAARRWRVRTCARAGLRDIRVLDLNSKNST